MDELPELRTMHMGPDALIVAARVALNDDITVAQAEDLAARSVLMVVPQAASRYLPYTAAMALALFAVALVLLGFARRLARQWRPRPDGRLGGRDGIPSAVGL